MSRRRSKAKFLSWQGRRCMRLYCDTECNDRSRPSSTNSCANWKPTKLFGACVEGERVAWTLLQHGQPEHLQLIPSEIRMGYLKRIHSRICGRQLDVKRTLDQIQRRAFCVAGVQIPMDIFVDSSVARHRFDHCKLGHHWRYCTHIAPTTEALQEEDLST